MTSDEELIACIQAKKEGKVIECRILDSDCEWEPKTHKGWLAHNWDYRIKPKPVKPMRIKLDKEKVALKGVLQAVWTHDVELVSEEDYTHFIQATPEVLEALKKAGVEL